MAREEQPCQARKALGQPTCGPGPLFRTPSLRNVATRHAFFHNGVFHSPRDAVIFYATRDTDPGRWYPKRPDGSVEAYDDLPPAYRAKLHGDPPFGGNARRQAALSDEEIDAIVAFLGTLTDGWEAGRASAELPR